MTITWEKPALRPVGLGRQVGIVTAAVAAYFGVRGATEAATDQALANAAKVVDFEKSVGLFHESWLQSTFAGSPAVATFFNWIYIYGHWPVIVATLIWLARTNPAIYYRTRNAMLLSGGIGLVVFMLFPLAPPRLAELGLVDTVTQSDGAYRVLQPTMFTNQYAAMPSLHVGWDLLIGLAILAAARRPLLRAFGAAMPVLMVAAVVLTANHYLVDAIAGAALTTTCWLVLRARERRQVRGYAGWNGLALR
ncbi:phosphatase PAP2 family protein [Dactylosporangium sp. NPDC050588]|uniref:phosphatase PAP2 family protein n=1 Tax=Dactylosporangium sp. NPDC050588 TaxID=3157211 RepID=UPI0034043D17